MTWTCFYAFLLFVILVVVVDTVWQWVTVWKYFFLFDSFVKRTLQLLSNVACSHVFLWVKIEYWVEGIHLYYWHYKSTILNLPWKWNNLKKRQKGRNFIWKIFDRIFPCQQLKFVYGLKDSGCVTDVCTMLCYVA